MLYAMTHSDIEATILGRLYRAFFLEDVGANLHEIRESGGWDEAIFWKTVDYLTHQDLISEWTMGGNYKIDPNGVVYAEKNGLAPTELMAQNEHVRTLALDFLARAYEESASRYSSVHIDTLAQDTGSELLVLANNMLVLSDLGYVEPTTIGFYGITYQGLEAVDDWRQRKGRAEEFEAITEMSPQPRGLAFQKLFAKLVETSGWRQEESARTSHEEMDVILHKEREYYLVECKWEKDRVGASVIRELHGKLSNRVGVQGIVVSISGFTSGAVKQVEEYANSRVILLFGPEDVRSLIHANSPFEDLLNAKYQQLITRRKAVFK